MIIEQLASSVGWDSLKIFQLQDDILEALEYNNEDIGKLQNAYEIIFQDFITNSTKFFPAQLKDRILKFISIIASPFVPGY